MKDKTFYFSKIMLNVFIFSCLSSSYLIAQLADSPWPMYKHDTQHTSRSQYSGPQYPYLGWRIIKEAGFFQPNPIVGKDGNIYMRVNTKPNVQLWAIDPKEGNTRWIFECGVDEKHIEGSPAASADGTIYFAVTGANSTAYLYAITLEGKLKWKYQFDTYSAGATLVGDDGTIYLRTSSALYSLMPNGNLNWKKRISFNNNLEPAITTEGQILICAKDSLYSLNDKGIFNWKCSFWPYNATATMLVALKNMIYVFTSGRYVFLINPDGSKKYQYSLSWEPDDAAIGIDGSIYWSVSSSWYFATNLRLSALNQDGNKTWDIFSASADGASKIATDNENRIYVTIGGDLYVINKDGYYQTLDLNYYYWKNVIIGGDHFIVVTTQNLCCAVFDLTYADIPDLAILAEEIKFSPLVAKPGTKVEIQVPIHERTGKQGASCTCAFYLTKTAKLLDSCQVYVPASGSAFATGRFQTSSWETGYYDITVEVIHAAPVEENTANNRAQVKYRLVIDNTAPTLRFNSPQNAAIFPTKGGKINISFADETEGSGILLESFQITNSKPLGQATGAVVIPANTNFAKFFIIDDRGAVLEVLDSTSFPAGQNIMSAAVTDYSGNRASATINFIASYLTVTSPQNNSLVKSSPIKVRGYAISPFIASVRINGLQVPVNSDTFCTELYLKSGLNQISVMGYDQNNLVIKEIKVNVTLDVSAPTVKIEKPTSGQSFSYSPIQVEGTVEEKENKLMGVFINGIKAEVSNGTFILGTSDESGLEIGDGAFWIKVVAVDSSGNIGQDSVLVNGNAPFLNRLFLKNNCLNWLPFPSYPANTTMGYSTSFVFDETKWLFPLKGDINGFTYSFSLLAGCFGLGSAEMKAEVSLKQNEQEQVLASTPAFSGSMAGQTPLGYFSPQRKEFTVSGIDPNSLAGDTLILKVKKFGGDRVGLIFLRELNAGSSWIGIPPITTSVVDNANQILTPVCFLLSQNYPNPFNPETIIHYQLPRQAEVLLEIYNILGEKVAILLEENLPAGYYVLQWNGLDQFNQPVPSGIYLYSLKAGNFSQVRKMILIR